MMKKILQSLLIMMSLFVTSAWSSEHDPVIITSNDYGSFTSSKNQGSGAVLDIVREAFAEVDREVIFKFYPWKRVENEALKGRSFAAVPYFKTEEREKKFNYSDPLVPLYTRFFYHKEKFPNGFKWEKYEDFRGYLMGGVLGDWYVPLYEKAGVKAEIVPSLAQNLKKLAMKRVDFIIMDELTGLELINKHYPEGISKIGTLDKPENVRGLHLMISRTYPNSAEITAQFNKGLKILKKTNRYKEILEAYQIPE
jgi:polar amino acid transport system substrate-binding protein